MKLVPSRFSLFNDVFDDVFKDSFFGLNQPTTMRADIIEQDQNYLIDIELPGYAKEDINITMNNGYLNVNATRNQESSEKDKSGNIIRRERSYGSISRNFYVGETFSMEDVKAKYENGDLKITLPKKDLEQVETTKRIMID